MVWAKCGLFVGYLWASIDDWGAPVQMEMTQQELRLSGRGKLPKEGATKIAGFWAQKGVIGQLNKHYIALYFSNCMKIKDTLRYIF